jgi:hypothetical protein
MRPSRGWYNSVWLRMGLPGLLGFPGRLPHQKDKTMPKMMPPEGDGEMDSMYSGGAPAEGAVSAEGDEGKESVDQENTEGTTVLIPNKILSPEGEPLKEGDEVVVRVVKNYGDECEVEYAPKEGGAEGQPAAAGETDDSMGANGEIAALDTGKAY